MTRRSLSLLVVSLALALTGSDSSAQAPPLRRVVADTGLITLGPNQRLRLTLSTRAGGEVLSSIRQLSYGPGSCAAGVCTHPLLSRTTSDPVVLDANQGASFDIPNTAFAVRGIVLTNGRNLRVQAEIVDETTNQIIAICIG
jgi:hypothetical protein